MVQDLMSLTFLTQTTPPAEALGLKEIFFGIHYYGAYHIYAYMQHIHI